MSNRTEYRACAVVPYYNHPDRIADVVVTLNQILPVIIVDDGSSESCRHVLDDLVERYGARDSARPVSLVRHQYNQGKGSAVISGLEAAHGAGFTHAVQVDADGQHDLKAWNRLLDASMAHPDALVLGYPIYDQSLHKGRYYSRYLTHVWVWINTLSLEVRDSMCGFRVYPVDSTLGIVSRERAWIAKRMGFDTEICVRSVWEGMQVVNLPVNVLYPSNGTSHFRLFQDNLEITWMHTRCFFSMLRRVPRLLQRKFQS